jgi:hypothetical protein
MDKTTEQRQRDHDENYRICPKCCYSIPIATIGWPSTTPPANPQGEGQGFLFQSIDVTLDEYYTRRMRTKPTQRRLLDLEFIGRIQRMHAPWMPKPEAARVPPESHIMQAARLAEALPASDDADDSASEIISRFEKGAAKPLLVPENPTCPVCLNHRFVVTCIDCQVDLSDHIPSLWDKKYLHEAMSSKPAEPLHNILDADLNYAKSLASSLNKKHYPWNKGFKILDDMQGVLSQIDNMTCGMVRNPPQPKGLLEAAKAVLDWYRERVDIHHGVFIRLGEAIEAQGGNEK